jgi:hypothetical protein
MTTIANLNLKGFSFFIHTVLWANNNAFQYIYNRSVNTAIFQLDSNTENAFLMQNPPGHQEMQKK